MDENKEFIPTLTLDPNAAAAAAVSAAPEAALPAEKKPEAPAEKLDIDRLSPAERHAVRIAAALGESVA